ncbi:MAG: AraC family transcriptional regulator [Gammaproteobacteria bacterium]|nr:MAG: AraC family transcriptional regulator [Gammaproteobacteria bacterium]
MRSQTYKNILRAFGYMNLSIFNIHDVVLFVTMALCLLLAIFHFFSPNKNVLAKYFLTLFFINISVDLAAILAFWNSAVRINPVLDNHLLPYILFGSLLLKGPLLYGYVSAITMKDFRLKLFDAIHLVPIAVYFLFLFISGRDTDDIRAHLISGDEVMRTLSLYEWHAVKISPLVYAVLAIYKVNLYSRHLKNQYSSLSPEGPAWLSILTWGVLLNWSWSLSVHLVGFYSQQKLDNLGIADNYLTLILIISLFVYSLVYANKLLAANFDSSAPQYEKSAESSIIEKITHSMEVEKLFLNPRLNIERMSEHINVPYREVSAVLNNHFNANFFEYINLHRINEAKRLLSDSTLIDLPISEIYVQAGFNSKSAFHRFFNRLVGMSPSEFRKQSLAATESDTNKNTAT